MALLREHLASLAGIAQGARKAANVPLRRAGSAKPADIGSAVELHGQLPWRTWSPAYAAPEKPVRGETAPRSDLASLGHVLMEMLAGRPPFEGPTIDCELLAAKAALEQRLPDSLPLGVAGNEMLLGLYRRLAAADPSKRFAGAQAADPGSKGATAFSAVVRGALKTGRGPKS
jgi:serine/threonine protein kinase